MWIRTGLRHSLTLLLVVTAALVSCKRLPNPEADEVSRVIRAFDRAHRPNGGDLPLERFFAWAAHRDAGQLPPDDLNAQLQALANEQVALIKRIRNIQTTSDEALAILNAYLIAHTDGSQAMEEVLNARRLGDPRREERGEAAARNAMSRLQDARSRREATLKRLGVSLPEPRRARDR